MPNFILKYRYLYEYIAVISVSIVSSIWAMYIGTLSPMIVLLENDGYHNIPPVSKAASSWILNSVNIGTLFGAITTSFLSDRIGKKRSLLLAQAPQILAHIFIYFARNIYMIYASTILHGISLSMGYGIIPNYISEVASAHLRGPSTAFGMFLLPVGGFIGGMVQSTASLSFTTIVMAILTLAKKRDEDCKRSLRKLRRTQSVDEEFLEIQTTWNDTNGTNNVNIIQLFRNNINRRVFFICTGLQIVQQVTGYLPMFGYSHQIIYNSGLNLSLLTITIMINTAIVFFSILSIFVIEKIGRRLLFISACIMVILGLGMLTASFYFEHDYPSISFGLLKAIGILIYVSACGFAFNFFHLLMAAELFPSDFKSKGVSIIVMFDAIYSTIITLIYSALFSIVDYLPFLVFCILTVLGLIFGYFFVPETKNKSLAEIQYLIVKS